MRRVVSMIAVVLFAFSVAACGKKGPPEAPPGEKPSYPRAYPR